MADETNNETVSDLADLKTIAGDTPDADAAAAQTLKSINRLIS